MLNLFNQNDMLKIEYAVLLKKYTSIRVSFESIDEGIKIQSSGKFANHFECTMFQPSKGVYAIRFPDNMQPEEFNTVFQLLMGNWGEPDYFSEWNGYVWKEENCILTFGLISLNYNYDVPMICVRSKLSTFFSKIPYAEYCLVADAMTKPLQNRQIYTANFYKILYSKEFGFTVIKDLTSGTLFVKYKNSKLAVSFIPTRSEEQFKIMEIKKAYKTELSGVSIPNIEHNLSKLLDEISTQCTLI